jgi:hypothetical protein
VKSFQDIIRGRQQEGFVGRGGELAQFAANLALPVNDPARLLVFSVQGMAAWASPALCGELRRTATEGARYARGKTSIFRAAGYDERPCQRHPGTYMS